MAKKTSIAILALLLVYALFFPLPSPELAIRRSLLTQAPLSAFAGEVIEGKIKNDPRYGDLYIVPEIELSFVFVKKNNLGWYVDSNGTAP